jgi:ABC-type transport system substrate-binding protein
MRWIPGAIELALLVILIVVGGCAEPLAAPIPAAHDDDTPRRGGTLHLASFGDIRNLDPAGSSDGLSGEAIQLLYAGIVDYAYDGSVVPDLASRFEMEPDGKTYRFFLRENVRFHDGEELTADDVKRSIERALHPTTPNVFASFFDMIEGFTEYTEKGAEHLSGVVVEGRYVVAIRLSHADATFLPVLALKPLRPVCRSAGNRYADSFSPCGTGPFRLEPGGWDRGRSLTIVRFDGFYAPGLPYLDRVTWTYGMNAVTQRFKFEDGELDVFRDFVAPDLIRFQNDPRWKPFGAYDPDRQTSGLAMNTEMAPFDNVEVRRAVAAAIDREQIAKLKVGTLRPLTQAVPPGVPGYDPDLRGQSHDLEAAREHMRRAGYPDGYGPTIPYLVYNQGTGLYVAQVVQQQLLPIGLKTDIRIASYPTYLALTHRRRQVPLSPAEWTLDYPDPLDFLEPLFASKAINDEDSNNTAFYKNPTFDDLVSRARVEIDPKKRQALYDEANRLVCDDAPWAFTFTYRWYSAWQPYVRNYKVHPVWTNYVRDVWLDRAADGLRAALSDVLPLRGRRRP